MQKMPEPGIWRLWFEYTRNDGIIGHSSIPMKRKGEPAPANHQGPLWEFFERSPFLDCSPSVRILGPHDGAPDHFHNTGQWTNYYVVMKHPFGSEPDGRDLCGHINTFEPGDFDRLTDAAKQTYAKEIRDRRIFKLRDEGILL